MSSRSSLRLLPLLLGVLLVWAFVARIGVRAIFDELSRLGPDALWILVPYAVGTALSGLPWAWLLEPSQRPRYVDAVASRFAASGANALLPFFGLAGEPCRLLWLSQGARAEGLAAIVVDRLLYNSMGGLWLVLGASAGLATRLPRVVSGSAAAVGVLVFCGSLLVLHGFSRWRMARGVQRVLQRLLGNAQRDPELGARVDAALHRLLEGRARPVLVPST